MATMFTHPLPIDLTRLQWVPMSTVPLAQRAEAQAFTDRVCDAILEARRTDPNDRLFGQTAHPTRPDPIAPLAAALRRERPTLTAEQAYAEALDAAPPDVQARALDAAGIQRLASPAADATPVRDECMAEIDELVDIMLRQHPGEFTREQATASLLEVRPELYARYLASR